MKLAARAVALLVLAASLAVPATPAAQETAAVYQGAAAEAFLAKAKVVAVKDLGSGITNPQKATLALDGVTRFAVFKSIDESKQGVTRFGDGSVEVDFQDSWQTEVAAYQVDLMIGLGLVPATIERRIGNSVGSLQWWVESMMPEAQRVKDKVSPPDVEAWNRLMFKVRLFDQLIANVDRHLNNILVTKDFDVRLIDHSRAFRATRELKNPDDLKRFSKSLLDGITRLNQRDLRAKVSRYLTSPQIDRLLQRRDAILALVKKRIAEQGEAAVIYP